MFIAKAYAQATDSLSQLEGDIPPMPEAASAGELLFTNLAIVGVLVFLFYVLLILPQQRRFKEHNKMLNALKKGDTVVTGGGLVGKVHKITEGDDEVEIDLGGGLMVTALRSTIHTKQDPRVEVKSSKPAADKAADKKDEGTAAKGAGTAKPAAKAGASAKSTKPAAKTAKSTKTTKTTKSSSTKTAAKKPAAGKK